MENIGSKYAIEPFRAIGSIVSEFAASISSSLNSSRLPGHQIIIYQNSVKNIVGRSFLDSSFFPHKIVVLLPMFFTRFLMIFDGLLVDFRWILNGFSMDF